MTENKEKEATATAKTAPKETDFIEKIGQNFNLINAKELFGDKAVEALNAVARSGKFGFFNDAIYENPLFGGLAIPQGKDFIDRRAEINTALNELL